MSQDDIDELGRQWIQAGMPTVRVFQQQVSIPFGTLLHRLRRYTQPLGLREFRQRQQHNGDESSSVRLLTPLQPQGAVRVEPAELAEVNWPHMFRVAAVDFEVASFAPWGVHALACVSWMPFDEEAVYTLTLRFSEHGNDRRLVVEAIRELSRFDILVMHYGNKFDLPWLWARADHLGLPPFRRWMVIDTCLLARRVLKGLPSRTLAALIAHYRLPFHKPEIDPVVWSQVYSQDEDEFDYAMGCIVDRNVVDVMATRAVIHRLWPLVMSSRFSSSSPIIIQDQGAGAGPGMYEYLMADVPQPA